MSQQNPRDVTINPTREQLYRFAIHSCIRGTNSPTDMKEFANQIVGYDHQLDRDGAVILKDPQQIEDWNTLVSSNFTLSKK